MSETAAGRPWQPWAVGGLVLGGLAMLRVFERQIVPFLPFCPLHAFTGLYCPGCGVTRATRALLHGDLQAAWQWNALFVVALPVAAILVLNARFSDRPLVRSPWVGWTIIGAIVLFGIVRNLPFAPFAALAPH